MLAGGAGNTETVKVLVEHGASLDLADHVSNSTSLIHFRSITMIITCSLTML